MSVNPIKEFYRDQEIFITGGTGLIGKSLVEKFLRSYPDISKIYLLLREKRGKSFDVRAEEFKNNGIFDLLRKTNSKALDKISCIKGDIEKIGLGLSEDDLEQLKNVSIVFHVAATVRFDEPLKKAIFQNVRATEEALKIAEKLKNIKKFVHVSTAYSNPYESVIKEEIYPPCADWKIFIKAAGKIDSDLLDGLMPKLITKFPNSYTFSKHLAEYVVNSYKDRLPVVIYRPSIVANGYHEPFPGWYDAFTSATGLIAAAYTGLARVVHCRPDVIFDIIPLDVTSLCLTVVAWKDYILPPPKPDENVRVFNIIGSNYRPETATHLFATSIKAFEKAPLMKCVWYPRITCIENTLLFMINFYLFHLMPAIFLDALLKLTGNKPFLVHIQRRYLATLKVLHFFMVKDYKFENRTAHDTLDDIRKYCDFPLDKMLNTSTAKLMDIGALGIRKYLFKETSENIPNALFKFKILKYLDMFIRYYFYYWVTKTAYNYILEHWPFV